MKQSGGGGLSYISVVHMRDQRNVKKGCFWDWMREARIAFRGQTQNVPVFKKNGPIWTLLGGVYGSFCKLLYSTKHVPPPKKNLV